MTFPFVVRLKNAVKGWLYAFYTRRLEGQLRLGSGPTHIALILDGNRRYAKKFGMAELAQGYYQGFLKARDLVRWCDELRIPIVTFWILSTDNLRREETELAGLFKVIEEHVTDLIEPGSCGIKRKLQAIGELEMLPESVRKAIAEAEQATANADGFVLNLAIAYDGREEIVHAVHRVVQEQGKQQHSTDEILDALTMEEIAKHTYMPDLPAPDLIIRTSGEIRLSGFLLWHSVHSEFYFCDALWPEFRKLDLLRAIRSYQQRQRRYGK